jgi:hypothetical protein
MKLTIAELEADQTGERINLVNEYKVKTGQAMTGAHRQGYGFTVKTIDGIKRVVRDAEVEHVVYDIISHFLVHQNKQQALIYVRDKYNIELSYKVVAVLLSNSKLYGHHRGNDDYCEAYIDKETFDKIQGILNNNIKSTPSKRTYLFTGLIKCPKCGRTLTSYFTQNRQGTPYFYYRCANYSIEKICTFNVFASEKELEKLLLNNLDQYINEYFTEVQVSNNRADVDNELVNKQINDIKLEMKNTTTAFRKNRMTEKEYDKEYNELEVRLKELESHLEPQIERDLTVYTDLLKSGWRELYMALTKENKRAFWRRYIKNIELNNDGTFSKVIFF